MKIELSSQQLAVLNEFLARVQLQGREVAAYVDLIKNLQPIPEQMEVKE